MSWLAKLLGFGSLNDPRGVRADFCDFCTTISPHWAYDRAAALQQSGSAQYERNRGGSFQLCQICCAKSELPAASILMPRQSAQEIDIEELIEQTNPALFGEAETERIAARLAVRLSQEDRRLLALQAFARAQEDLATDTFRLADLRIWGGLFIVLAVFFRILRRIARGGGALLLLLITAVLIYRFVFVPRLVRVNQRPAWIRLLTGASINFGDLATFLEENRTRFPRTANLLKAREYRSLGDDGLLQRDPAALQPGRDFLPAARG